MEIDLVLTLSAFLKEEKIKMELREVSNSEFWLESPNGFMAVRFFVDENAHQILYDVFSPKYDTHLKEETLRDVERLDLIVEDTGRWEYEKPIEDFWLILDCVKLWAQKNKFEIKEKEII